MQVTFTLTSVHP